MIAISDNVEWFYLMVDHVLPRRDGGSIFFREKMLK